MKHVLVLTLTGRPHFNAAERKTYGVPEEPTVLRENGNLIVDFPCDTELCARRVTAQASNPDWGREVIPVEPKPGHVHATVPGDAAVAVINLDHTETSTKGLPA